MVWYGMAWHGMVWYGVVWYGMYGTKHMHVSFVNILCGHRICKL